MTIDEKDTISQIASPCVRNCCLNGQDICMGCGRSLEEIIRWRDLDNAEKIDVLALSAFRRENLINNKI